MCSIRFTALAATLCFMSTHASARDLAYAYNSAAAARQIVTFPVAAPLPFTPLGPQADLLAGIDFDPSATVLHAINLTALSLGTIDTQSGAFTGVAPLAPGCCSGFTVDPVTGTLYGNIERTVHRIDPATGALIVVAVIEDRMQLESVPINALTLDCSGQGFATGTLNGTTYLYRWRPSGGAALVGIVPLDVVTSIESDNRTGLVYAWSSASGGTDATYASIDTSNGNATPIALVEGRFRMAIRNPCDRFFSDGFDG